MRVSYSMCAGQASHLSLRVQMYGFPRLYRKSQQLARWSIKDKPTLKLVSGRIGYAWRVPNTFAGTVHCVVYLGHVEFSAILLVETSLSRALTYQAPATLS